MTIIEHAPKPGRYRHPKGEFVDTLTAWIDPDTLLCCVAFVYPGRMPVRWALTLEEWHEEGFSWIGETPRRAKGSEVWS